MDRLIRKKQLLVMGLFFIFLTGDVSAREDRPYGILDDPLPPDIELLSGTVFGLSNNGIRINIDDIDYMLKSDALYLTLNKTRTKQTYFQQGMFVQFNVLDKIIYELWESASPEKGLGAGQEKPTRRDDGGIRLDSEDGVWRN